jgi:hypothetical protein
MDTAARDSEPERLIARMQTEGVALTRDTILDVVQAPRWDATRSRHDWHTHVPPAVRAVWPTLPLEARLCIFETAQLAALREEGGATMITGPADSL